MPKLSRQPGCQGENHPGRQATAASRIRPFGSADVYCLYTGHAYLPRRRGPILDLQGWEAVVLAVACIAFGAFLHFQFFWGRHSRLRSWSPRLKHGALLFASWGIGYVLLRRFF